MNREEFLRNKISSLGTLKDFAIKIDMPYSTLLSILKNVGGASIDNIIKICDGLNITPDDLSAIPSLNRSRFNGIYSVDGIAEAYNLSPDEKFLIKSFLELNADDRVAVAKAFVIILNRFKQKL